MHDNIGCRRILLEGADNVRDLGGFCTIYGNVTKFCRLVRSEELSGLTTKDFTALYDYGIRNCIDLRSNLQIQNYPSKLVNDTRFEYFTINVDTSFSEKNGTIMYSSEFKDSDWIGILYGILNNQKEWIAEVMKTFLKCSGGVIFNCNTGRNRSNIVAMLILLVSGVPSIDIIAEYATNEVYLKQKYCKWDGGGKKYSSGYYKTSSFVMDAVIEKLLINYGTVEKYLCNCGLSIQEVQKIGAILI